MIKWTRAPAFNKEELLDIYSGLLFLQADLENKVQPNHLLPPSVLGGRLENVNNLLKKIMNEIEKLNRSK